MGEKNGICERVRKFIFDHFPSARFNSINDDYPLLEGGIIDSLGILELIQFMEDEFNVSISDEDLIPENFQTIRYLSSYIEKFVNKENKS